MLILLYDMVHPFVHPQYQRKYVRQSHARTPKSGRQIFEMLCCLISRQVRQPAMQNALQLLNPGRPRWLLFREFGMSCFRLWMPRRSEVAVGFEIMAAYGPWLLNIIFWLALHCTILAKLQCQNECRPYSIGIENWTRWHFWFLPVALAISYRSQELSF